MHACVQIKPALPTFNSILLNNKLAWTVHVGGGITGVGRKLEVGARRMHAASTHKARCAHAGPNLDPRSPQPPQPSALCGELRAPQAHHTGPSLIIQGLEGRCSSCISCCLSPVWRGQAAAVRHET